MPSAMATKRAPPQEDGPPGGPLRAGVATAEQVVAELGSRCHHFRERNRNYFRLVSYLCFVTLFLATLFLQRNAHVSYQVYSTVASGLLPDPSAIGTTDDIYTWLQQLLVGVWQDPVCGDGVCEVPFEYAAYGRFGCRADCGRLQDIQNLTAIQLDLYFDFNHPAGSIPATELMNQVSWNLCPQSGAGGCYWADDQAFDRLAGSISVAVPDVPDGDWALVVKRDIFGKVRGAVRIVPLLATQALASKVAIALRAAGTARTAEAAALQQALDIAGEDLVGLVNATLQQQYAGDVEEAQERLANGTMDAATYTAQLVSLQLALEEDEQLLEEAALVCPEFQLNWPGTWPLVNDTSVCERYANLTLEARAAQLDAMRSVVSLRLAPLRALSDGVVTAGLQQLLSALPEVYAVAAAAYGTDGQEPAEASTSTLAQYYVEGPYSVPPPAKAALSSRLIASDSMTVGTLAALVRARLAEMAAATARVAALSEVQLASNLTAPGGAVNYNYVQWEGGADRYLTCDLESRTPQYVGTCAPALACSSSQVVGGDGRVQVLYSCPAGGLDADACGDACDTQQLCRALCACDPGCGLQEVCTCTACQKVASARTESDYLAMEALAAQAQAVASGFIEAFLGEVAQGSGGSHRRGLKASSTDTMLQTIMAAVGELQDGQAALQADVTQLGAQVQAANAAEASGVLQALISQGQQQILVGQGRIQTLLAEIIGKQDAAASAAAATAQALANLQTLQQQQLQAQQQLEQANRDKVEAIKVALQQGLLSLSQALELYRQARVQNLVASKAALLATEPCTTQTAVEHAFTVDQYDQPEFETSRVRHLGLTNRVVAGLLLFARRDVHSNCTGTRFSEIDNECDGALDLQPYGVDPVFKVGTALYNPDLDDSTHMAAYYNCSALGTPTYNVTREVEDGQGQRLTNPPPFCAELFNPRNLPWGFHSMRLRRLGAGFPAVLDINLSQGAVLQWLGFLQEGLFLGTLTRSLLAQVVTYNPDLHLFSASSITFDFSSSGSVEVSYKIETLRVELYVTATDRLRLAMEALLCLCILYMFVGEMRGLYLAMRRNWNPLSYFTDAWHMVDFASTALLVATAAMWCHILRTAARFRISLRYDVYQDLQAEAAFLTLANGGAGLQEMHDAFGSLQDLSNSLAWYYALNGINLMLLISRMLQLMDFQPRLGVVTRSLKHAGPDLLHFCLVFSLVFVGYAMLAHLIFGNGIQGFSTFGGAVETCFAILLGDISVNDDLKALSGLQAAAGALFFWSYEILVFLVLLNFLLAIIVDAFADVKSRTTDTTGIQTELAQVVAHLYHSAVGRLRGDRIDDRALGQLLGDYAGSGRPSDGGRISHSSSEDGGGADGEQRALLVKGKPVSEDQLKSILQARLVPEEGDIESLPASPSKTRLGCHSLFHARQSSPSRRVLKGPAAADADQLAHYVMLRFGEDLRSKEAAGAKEASPAADQQHQQGEVRPGSPFSITAVRGADAAAGPGPGSVAAGAAVQHGFGNGQQLAGRIRAEYEESGLHQTLRALLEMHRGLREGQAQVLRLQQQLAGQQADTSQLLQLPGPGGGGGSVGGRGGEQPASAGLHTATSVNPRWSGAW